MRSSTESILSSTVPCVAWVSINLTINKIMTNNNDALTETYKTLPLECTFLKLEKWSTYLQLFTQKKQKKPMSLQLSSRRLLSHDALLK